MVWTVHKFGGTSVADASCFRRVAGIVAGEQTGNLGVVVSAMRGVTDELLGLIEKAARREPVTSAVASLRERHEKTTIELLGAASAKPLVAELDQELEEIESILKASDAGALGVAAEPRSRVRVRRSVVGAHAGRVSRAGARRGAQRRVRQRARRARHRARRDGTGRSLGRESPEARRSRAAGFRGSRRDHGLHRLRPRGVADDARSQRQRLFRIDLRRVVRRERGAYLDRRRRRHERRSAPRSGSEGHRRDVVQRGDGARVLRREGDSSADDGARGRQGHSDPHSQHLQRASIRGRKSRPRPRLATGSSRASAASTASRW